MSPGAGLGVAARPGPSSVRVARKPITPATIASTAMLRKSVRRGWRSRAGAKSAVSPDSERSTLVASPVAEPVRAASMASTSSRSCTSSATVA